jgi:hypothetical protein
MSQSSHGAHKNAINISTAPLGNGSVEVARLWVENRGVATCLIQPDRLATPEMFGTLMVDAVQEAARAFAQLDGIGEDVALDRIWRGLEAEQERLRSTRRLNRPFGKV